MGVRVLLRLLRNLEHQVHGNGHTEVVKILLEHDAIDSQDNNGWSALVSAMFQQHTEIVKLLLDHGAEIDTNMTAASFISNPDINRLLKTAQTNADSKSAELTAQDQVSS